MKKCDRSYVLKHVLGIVNSFGKKESEIKWVGNEKEKMTWDQFKNHVDFQRYDGSASDDIVYDLMIVADDWYLSRVEEYGDEYWRFNTHPVEPTISNPNLSVLTENFIKEWKRVLARKLSNKKYRENKKKKLNATL